MRCDGLVAEVQDWAAGLEEVHLRIAGAFARAEPRVRVLAYLRGLLEQLERKNGWTLAEAAGEVSPDGMQRLLRTADWNADTVRDELRAYVVERLGPGGVLIVDETGFIKKGTCSAGVGRQYTGTTGKIDNCQIGVFCAYATPAGRALIDRELYLPRAWTDDRERARAAGIDDAVPFATKPDLARRMLTRALDAGVPAGWLTADEIYGQDKRLRVWCEQRGLPYVLATRSNDTVATIDWRQRRVRALIAELPESAWARCSAGAGAHGQRLSDCARIELLAGFDPSWSRWVLARRTIPADPGEEPQLAYYVCAGPTDTSLEQLVAVAGGRWRIEECFQAAKNEAGLASYQVRDYTAWYRHITLAMLAHAYLSATRASAEKGGLRPEPSSSSR
ncbi:IS701 family transposase [Geodermatophilus maliterrae]|uniref:IS701 family transposase n=1 Tax=Geodermatophilus maliterrae TaxID=3162531 RepID=A0ABV3XMG0_9ACTN